MITHTQHIISKIMKYRARDVVTLFAYQTLHNPIHIIKLSHTHKTPLRTKHTHREREVKLCVKKQSYNFSKPWLKPCSSLQVLVAMHWFKDLGLSPSLTSRNPQFPILLQLNQTPLLLSSSQKPKRQSLPRRYLFMQIKL